MLLCITHVNEAALQFGNFDAATVIRTPGTLPPGYDPVRWPAGDCACYIFISSCVSHSALITPILSVSIANKDRSKGQFWILADAGPGGRVQPNQGPAVRG